MKPIIEVQNLSKLYQIGAKEAYGSLRDEIMQAVTSPFKRLKPNTSNLSPITDSNTDTDLWALKDVSFEVNEGEVVGIIGRNGAGKSTLLKILSRITEPTSGRVVMRGRVASLLEVGTGFHPELTGRENIFLNGALLGMSSAEIRKKFDEIVAFSEIEKFLDTPVKRYSSGMYVRLAFAVAAHLEPEILIVDEVLAVGDVSFQKKSLGRMEEVSKEGRTVLFVSHNMNAIAQLCDKSILLDKGAIIHYGESQKVITHYFQHSTEKGKYGEYINKVGVGSDYLKPLRMVLLDKNNIINNKVKRGDILKLLIEFELLTLQENLTIGISLFDFNGNHLFRSLTTDADPDSISKFIIGKNIIEFDIPTELLNEGQYSIIFDGGLYMTSWDFNPFSNKEISVLFEIEGGYTFSPFWRLKRAGIFAPTLSWRINNE